MVKRKENRGSFLGNLYFCSINENPRFFSSLWPDYTSAWNNLGAVSKDPQVAEQSFLSALKSNPHHGGAHFNLGVIYM